MSQTDTETGELQLAPEEPNEPPMKQLAPYDEFKAKIESIRKTAETITVSDISQTAEMKIARTTRLALKDIRIAITHRHKELKEGILVEGRKIDAGKNELLAVLEPLELRLRDQEEFIERETARIQAEKHAARIAEITPFLSAPLAVDLGIVLDDRYSAMLQDAKDAHAAKLAREQREREEAEEWVRIEKLSRARAIELAPLVRFIKTTLSNLGAMSDEDYAAVLKQGKDGEAAEEAAKEEQRVENARLKKEAEEREARAKSEREAAAKQLADERRAAEEKAAKLKKEAEEVQRTQREEARKREEELAAKAKAEREEAAKENARLAKIAEEQRQKAATAARIAREDKEKSDREIAAIHARGEAEKKRISEEHEAAEKLRVEAVEKARMAPEKEKLAALAARVRAIEVPSMITEKGEQALAEIEEYIEKLAKHVEKLSAKL